MKYDAKVILRKPVVDVTIKPNDLVYGRQPDLSYCTVISIILMDNTRWR